MRGGTVAKENLIQILKQCAGQGQPVGAFSLQTASVLLGILLDCEDLWSEPATGQSAPQRQRRPRQPRQERLSFLWASAACAGHMPAALRLS